MEIRKLVGGKTIGVKTDRLPTNMYADDPAVRFRGPGTWHGNAGASVLFSEAARKQVGEPKPAEAKVVIREVGGEVYILVAFPPRTAKAENAPKDLDIYRVGYTYKTKAPIIRGLKRLLKDAGVSILPDLWYIMTPELVQDDQLGYAVACNWTKAKTEHVRQPTKAENAQNQPVTAE